MHPVVRLRVLQEQLNESIEAIHDSAVQSFMPGGQLNQLAVNATATNLNALIATVCHIQALLMQEHRKPWMMLETGD